LRVIDPSVIIIDCSNIMRTIERGGRICYKSEDKICEGSDAQLIKRLKNMKHESVLEHSLITVQIVTDRGVTHELVRHRLCAFSQESTRYCNYGKDKFGGVTFIRPYFFSQTNPHLYNLWVESCQKAESTYLDMLKNGATAQEARSVLPNSLKTEIQVSANVREWNHIFKLRTHRDAHPQMQQIMIPLAQNFYSRWPFLFEEEYFHLSHPNPANIIWEV